MPPRDPAPAARTCDLPALAEQLRAALGDGWCVAITAEGLAPTELTAGERARYLRLPQTGLRRQSWLLGRRALRTLLEQLGEPPDTARMRLPHPRLSLTHGGGVAIAVGRHDRSARGVGVDLEPRRVPNLEVARFFLRGPEASWLAGLAPHASAAELLRLWTAKEAVFKADLGNAGRVLRGYALHAPAAWHATAARADAPDVRFRYRTWLAEPGYITVATREDGWTR